MGQYDAIGYIHLLADMRYHRGINYNLSANTIPQCLLAFNVRWCVSLSGVFRFYCSPSAFTFGSYVSPSGDSVLLLIYRSHRVLSAWPIRAHLQFLLQSARDWLVRVSGICYTSGLTVLSVGYELNHVRTDQSWSERIEASWGDPM